MKYLSVVLVLAAFSVAGTAPALSRTIHHSAKYLAYGAFPAGPLYLYSHHGYFRGGYYPVTGRKALELDGILN